jgi:hypothetical protein
VTEKGRGWMWINGGKKQMIGDWAYCKSGYGCSPLLLLYTTQTTWIFKWTKCFILVITVVITCNILNIDEVSKTSKPWSNNLMFIGQWIKKLNEKLKFHQSGDGQLARNL